MNEVEKELLIKLKRKVFDLESKLNETIDKVERIQDYLEEKHKLVQRVKM